MRAQQSLRMIVPNKKKQKVCISKLKKSDQSNKIQTETSMSLNGGWKKQPVGLTNKDGELLNNNTGFN